MIDVHAHYVPDGYRAAIEAAGHARPDGMPAIPEWSAVDHVALMDRLGIEVSMLSISSPGVLTNADDTDLGDPAFAPVLHGVTP